MTNDQLNKTIEFVTPFYNKTGKYHAWDHILAVRKNALKIASHYKKVNLSLLEAACYIHDIGRSVKDEGHAEESTRLITPLLRKIAVNKDEIETILDAVSSHDISRIKSAKSLEAKILFDADKMEILSVFGFIRVSYFVIEERHMETREAFNLLHKYCTTVYKNYLQTPYAKIILKSEIKLIDQLMFKFKSWNPTK